MRITADMTNAPIKKKPASFKPRFFSALLFLFFGTSALPFPQYDSRYYTLLFYKKQELRIKFKNFLFFKFFKINKKNQTLHLTNRLRCVILSQVKEAASIRAHRKAELKRYIHHFIMCKFVYFCADGQFLLHIIFLEVFLH